MRAGVIRKRTCKDCGDLIERRTCVRCRFWQKVSKDGHDGCWLWTGCRGHLGYGVSRGHSGRNTPAHRVAWALFHGTEAPSHLDVLHRCDVRSCVNPDHLFLGTHAENMADMAMKLRHGQRKLSPDVVATIRTRYANGEKQKALAVEFGVTQPTVSEIVHRKYWCHVE